jgi:hypothetical protein
MQKTHFDMRYIILTFFLGTIINAYGQNIKKILSKTELDSVNNGYTILKMIDKTNCDVLWGLQGQIKIFKDKNKIDFKYTDKMSTYYDNGNLKSQYVFDSLDLMQTYKEYTVNGEVIYDCKYEFKKINGAIYRLEHLKLYYEPNLIRQDGYRYMMYRDNKGEKTNFTQHKYGKWIYFSIDGKIEKTKNYGEIK